MPRHNAYGTWPASGEIDIMEARGNKNLTQGGVNIGTQRFGSTLHFGPSPAFNGNHKTHTSKDSPAGWDTAFHRYGMLWNSTEITFSVDGEVFTTFPVGDGFWSLGEFDSYAPGMENPWRFATKMAPFDQEFYFIFNLAVGGTGYFPDDGENPGGKPWKNNSPAAATDFWKGKEQWLPTWSNMSNFQIDYVRVWAI